MVLTESAAPEAATTVATRVAAFVIDDAGLVLMTRHADDTHTVPAGMPRPAERLGDAVARLVRESAGIEAEATGLVGVHGGGQWLTICLRARPLRGTLSSPDENAQAVWVEPEHIEELEANELVRSALRRVLTDEVEPFFV
ncbi:NUDIX domain-containing protein [Herbihabitans rhizosphaerae]|uniref:NUDIX domain-containing protein n=1 Tax=Herbihabitans rhizosphaerae TaxID=1872711 RepID=A0A4Q7L1M4_9PSEU|nr:NUDIX domain-containing protein [Herbihabitans rhizosphaerae]RZS43438.1 NUDIX domain-containing protein [Herbihabitans rhizosphaerae]